MGVCSGWSVISGVCWVAFGGGLWWWFGMGGQKWVARNGWSGLAGLNREFGVGGLWCVVWGLV